MRDEGRVLCMTHHHSVDILGNEAPIKVLSAACTVVRMRPVRSVASVLVRRDTSPRHTVFAMPCNNAGMSHAAQAPLSACVAGRITRHTHIGLVGLQGRGHSPLW